jgi:hypothetical protein
MLGLLVVLFIAMIAGSQLLSVAMARGEGDVLQSVRFGQAMPFWALLYLLATWLTAAADRGLVMRPAEIQFLIGGPFPMRDIITLNLLRLAYRALVSALVLSAVLWAYASSFLASVAGMWLLFCFSLLVGMLASLSTRGSQPGAVRWCRRIFSAVAIAGLLTIVAQSLRSLEQLDQPVTFSRVAANAATTPVGQWVLPVVGWMFAPLQAHTFWPEVPLALLVRLPVLGLLAVGIYALGGAFGEAATERTDRALERRQASLRSGSTVSSRALRHWQLPLLPRWGGVGSVARVEMLQALRMLPRFLLYTSAIVGLVLVTPLYLNRAYLHGLAGLGWMAGLTTYADFLLLLQLPVGFLGPPGQREMLKQLPIPGYRVVLGALAGPLLPLAVNHLLVAILFAILLPDQRGNVLITALALIPLACVLAATINLLGIWDIIKPRALQQRDALAAGRAMLSTWLFGLMLLPTMLLAGIGAVVSSLLLGNSFRVYALGAALGTACACMGFVALLAWSFERWQPTAGQAGEEEREFER